MSELFADRYDIQHELGRGAFGVVHLAHDVRLRGRQVALKVLHPALSTDPQVVRLFENEAGILAALRHDHIITVYDVGVWELRRYIVMDYVAGPSLAQVVKEQGAQPPERVRDWLRQAAEALAYAHGQGVLHRDVKSANLLLETARDRLFVSDFGLARAAEVSGGSSVQSEAHLLTGTAAYRAPEVHRTGHSVASDLYSLGVVGYELLAGRRPFESDDPLSLMLLHATEPVPPLRAGTPRPLGGLVMALLAKDPAQRPASATAVVEALADSEISPAPPPQEATPLPAELPPVKPPPPSVSLTSQPSERSPRRWLGWLAGGVVVVAILLLAVWAFTGGKGQRGYAAPTPTLDIGSTMISEIDGMELVYVPAGEFLMGSSDTDTLAYEDEKPQHTVYLDAFWIDKTEVTNAMFARFVEETGYQTDAENDGLSWIPNLNTGEWEDTPGTDWQHPRGPESNVDGLNDHPVVQVSWNDATVYCQWAGRRLPTEAEWEKAARGTDGRLFPWGNAWDANRLNSSYTGLNTTTVVGSYPTGVSPYGLLDMAGNVEEWVADWFDGSYYAQSPGQNPAGPENGVIRVLRGGSWNGVMYSVRAAFRSRNSPHSRFVDYGFRCAHTP